jgi:predicted HTH transcriptional regulator
VVEAPDNPVLEPSETNMTKSTSTQTGTAKGVARQHNKCVKEEGTVTKHNPDTDQLAVQIKKNKRQQSQTSKRTKLTKLLHRSRGASMGELEKAMGWQPHSIRAAISGLRKSGNTIERTPTKSGMRYHILEVAKESGSASV